MGQSALLHRQFVAMDPWVLRGAVDLVHASLMGTINAIREAAVPRTRDKTEVKTPGGVILLASDHDLIADRQASHLALMRLMLLAQNFQRIEGFRKNADPILSANEFMGQFWTLLPQLAFSPEYTDHVTGMLGMNIVPQEVQDVALAQPDFEAAKRFLSGFLLVAPKMETVMAPTRCYETDKTLRGLVDDFDRHALGIHQSVVDAIRALSYDASIQQRIMGLRAASSSATPTPGQV